MGTLWDAERGHRVWGHSEPGLQWHNPGVSPGDRQEPLVTALWWD